jgi:hypothetical protein
MLAARPAAACHRAGREPCLAANARQSSGRRTGRALSRHVNVVNQIPPNGACRSGDISTPERALNTSPDPTPPVCPAFRLARGLRARHGSDHSDQAALQLDIARSRIESVPFLAETGQTCFKNPSFGWRFGRNGVFMSSTNMGQFRARASTRIRSCRGWISPAPIW